MKKLILLFSLSLSMFSHANASTQRLMDCNLPSGDTQQATVVQDGSSLILIELDYRGIHSKRLLSQKEWATKVIKLKALNDATSTLSLTKDGWWFSYKSDGFSSIGFADCD